MTPSVDGSIGTPRFEPPPAQDGPTWPRRELGKGEILYRAGDLGETVYRVEEGLFKLALDAPAGRERILALAGPGDLLGALASSGGGLQETVQALSPQALITSIPRADMMAGAAEELLAAGSVQLDRLWQALEDVELPVAARLARTLIRLGCRFGHRSDDGFLWLNLPLTHEHLAAMVGAARETTSTALGHLREENLLTGTRGHYRFVPAQLESFVAEAMTS